MNSYPRATKQLHALLVTRRVNGALTPTTAYEVCVLPYGVPATDAGPWVAPVTLDGDTGPMIDHLAAATYTAYARPTGAGPEVPVIDCGSFRIT